jgi:hypothetical protein
VGLGELLTAVRGVPPAERQGGSGGIVATLCELAEGTLFAWSVTLGCTGTVAGGEAARCVSVLRDRIGWRSGP